MVDKKAFIRFHEEMRLIVRTWFTFPPKFWLKIKISEKLRHAFVDERAMITMTLISSCHWKTVVLICLQKEKTWKRIFKTDCELFQNHTEKQFMPSKTTVNWLFNDIWCYLFIARFDWKISVFQKTVVRVYYILK